MRLTVGREKVLEAGRAPGLAFAPNVLSRVGLALIRLSDCAPFKSLGVKRAELPCTDKPCCRPLCDIAFNAPGLFMLAK